MPNAVFDYTINFATTDFRQHPELYRIGKGEQGVLLVQPYKHEILPHWRFKTPDIAQQSAQTIYRIFLAYKAGNDFVGMDMARKFLQMGYTRSRRYANHKNGKKYNGPVPADKNGQSGAHGRDELPRVTDEIKAQSAGIFYDYWQQAKNDKEYQHMALQHRTKFENQD